MIVSRNKDNLDFIKNQIEKEGIYAPDSLGEPQMLSKILNTQEDKIMELENNNSSNINKKKTGKRVLAIAAAFVIVISAAFAIPYLRDINPKPVDEIGKPDLVDESGDVVLAHFNSETEIKSLINKMFVRERVYEYNLAKSVEDYATENAEGGMGGGDGAGEDFGTTYKQVEAVDEADIIKTDGTYIYHMNNNAIQVYAANNGEPYKVCAIEHPSFYTDDYSEINDEEYNYSYSYLSEFYLNDGKLIAISQESNGDYKTSNECTLVQVFDISDVKNAKLIDEYRQSGYYSSSRMIGATVYLVTNHYVGIGNRDFYIPYCGVGEGQNSLDAECIYKTASPSEACYLVVGAIDTENGVQNKDTKAIFGASSTVYCNENNMFITNTVGQYTYYAGYNSEYEGKIQIIKAELSEDEISFTAAGFVNGYVNDQFSMDEKDGCLRIATTTYNWGESETTQTNNLYVLDDKLSIIGSVTGFANDESIRAVRFLGDTAYVITYEYVDPLFIIDLSDKKNPQIKGSVEIEGFSSLLAPVDENTLLGIGYATAEGEFGMTTDGLKLVLFDVSDPENPQVLDFAEFNNAASEAQYNHKALVQNRDKGYFALPYQQSEYVENEDGYYDYYDYGSGVITFEAQDGSLVITNDYVSGDGSNDTYYECTPRCTYIGDYVYFIDRTGNISAFDYYNNTENAVG